MAFLVALTGASAAPDYRLVGFAALDGFATNGTFQAGGTTGGADGPHVQVFDLANLVHHLETNTAQVVEVMNDIDLAPLANHQGGFPPNYPVGEIRISSHKTLYSKNGATLRHGTLRIGKGPNGRQNIIIRNLRFRDLWVLDPTGKYDQYGWDHLGLEAGSHHVWVDHCDFEQAYDGMVDIKGGSDYVTVSWCVFRTQQKCSLVGASDNSGDVDRGHLNVTFHHNWYQDVAERLPRMRFGNAHVFNLYCVNLGGKGIQSTAGAATLVENAYFLRPQSDSYPTIEANGGPTGAVKVVNSTIVNLPGVRVAFREYGAADFRFNPPFLTNRPPYSYTLDSVAEVPGLVTNFAGLGKIGFELWQGEQFSAAEQANAAVSAPNAAPAGDGVPNLVKYALGLPPWTRVTGPLTTFRLEQGQGVLTYTRPATATDVAYQVQVSTNLAAWTSEAVEEQCVGTHAAGLQIWEARLTGPPPSQLLFRLRLTR